MKKFDKVLVIASCLLVIILGLGLRGSVPDAAVSTSGKS